MVSAGADTIFALSSAPGRAGIAVIRISGPAAGAALAALTGAEAERPRPREARLVALRRPADGEAIDRGLALWFPAPASATGEDVAELHVHGGRAVVAATLEALGALEGCRLAEPGEFARRAFHAGKLDLAATEGLADLIAAETEAQRRQALVQMGGALGRRTEALRARVIEAAALIEAEIDFVDEEDVPTELLPRARAGLAGVVEEIEALLADSERGERLREGLEVAIVGPPNVGKSSLFNAIARRDAAIVSAAAGTTRDVIEVRLDLDGLPVTLADTAGLRALDRSAAGTDEQSAVEAEGIRRARERAEAADIRLLVVDATAGAGLDPETERLLGGATLVAANKIDLLDGADGTPALGGALPVSALSGAGLDRLIDRLTALVAARLGGRGEGALVTRARHREALADCRAALARALARAGTGGQAELVAEDLRLAARALGRVAGRVDVEDILDVIFRDFCIGK